MKARPRIPPENDRRDRGPPPNNGIVKAVSPRHCPVPVDEQLAAKEVQLSQPSSTSLLMISSGLT